MPTSIKLTEQMWDNYAKTLALSLKHLTDAGPGIRSNYIRKRINHDWAADVVYAKDPIEPFTWNEYLVFEDPARALEFVLKYA